MYFHDELRDFGEIDRGESVKTKESELQLALRSSESWRARSSIRRNMMTSTVGVSSPSSRRRPRARRSPLLLRGRRAGR